MSSLTLKARLQEDMKAAMRAQDKARLDAIRLILAAVKQIEVDERIEVDDARMLAILDKMVKQRRDSIAQYEAAKRQDLADQENYELTIIAQYMPAPLTEREIETLISEAITACQAASAKDMGKVMAELKPKLQGRADIAIVSAKVKERLS
jgi:hypothetical protein